MEQAEHRSECEAVVVARGQQCVRTLPPSRPALGHCQAPVPPPSPPAAWESPKAATGTQWGFRCNNGVLFLVSGGHSRRWE